MPEGMRNRELVLPPSTYAFVLDSTKGKVSAYVGPYKNSLSETDDLVVWNTVQKRYVKVESTDQAIQTWALAEQGQYIVLSNPASDNSHPPEANINDAARLDAGKRVVVPGPATFPLWPGQTAETIDGHHLRHNQFVIVRVYDAQQAQDNWRSAVMAPQVGGADQGDSGAGEKDKKDKKKEEAKEGADTPQVIAPSVRVGGDTQFTMGQLIVVPGTEVSFYMPSTGMEVVPEADPTQSRDQRHVPLPSGDLRYVRDAVTLETLQYCILLDENGQKRYVRGPAVVFPNPTETFKVNDDNSRIFDAIELNEQTGLYIKVIEEYEEDGESHPVGEELFITGKQQAIYFPRAEHSIITYSGRRKHHAIAIPAGEGRYVLNRNTGNVGLVVGPTMLLPDPRFEVIVRRILDPHDVETMFPGNQEALAVNLGYASEREVAGGGTVALENAEMRRGALGGRAAFAANETPQALYTSAGGQAFTGDNIARGTTFTPPRTITLDTKYEGAVAMSIYPGYAVLVTDRTGDRRVEVGPKVVLLDYDETIAALKLSTGRPKTDRNLLRTGYLRVVNNVVTDEVSVETKDLVELAVTVSYRVNFEGDTPAERERWFDVENYVQVLTDNARSRLRNLAKRHEILDFYTKAIDLIRDNLLGVPEEEGADRPGLPFIENGMRIYDVEVLGVKISDPGVEKLLIGAQSEALSGAIQLSIAQQKTTRETQLQELKRTSLAEAQRTASTAARIEIERIGQEFESRLAEVGGRLSALAEQKKIDDLTLEATRARTEQEIELQKERDEQEMLRFIQETDQLIKRMDAIEPGFIAALNNFADHAMAEKIITAIGPAALAAGISTADMLANLFKDTAMEGPLKMLSERPLANLDR